LVFRHFWAPVHLSSIGPLQAGNNGLVTDLSIGPLGGLYKDKNLIQTFVTNAVSILLAQVIEPRTPHASSPRGQRNGTQ
jgi:hypothetical protein